MIAALALFLVQAEAPARQPVLPPVESIEFDMRCLITMSNAAQTSAENREALTTGAIYFLGRLNGRAPRLNVATQLAAEAERIAPSDVGPLLLACGAEMQRNAGAVSGAPPRRN